MQLSLSSLTFIMEFQLYWPCFKFWKLIVCLLFFFGSRVIKFNLTFHPFTLIPMILYTYLFFQQSMLYFTTHSSLHTSAIFLSILFFFFFFSFSAYNQIYPEKVNMVHLRSVVYLCYLICQHQWYFSIKLKFIADRIL